MQYFEMKVYISCSAFGCPYSPLNMNRESTLQDRLGSTRAEEVIQTPTPSSPIDPKMIKGEPPDSPEIVKLVCHLHNISSSLYVHYTQKQSFCCFPDEILKCSHELTFYTQNGPSYMFTVNHFFQCNSVS